MGSCCDKTPSGNVDSVELSQRKKNHPVVKHFEYARETMKNSEIYKMECKHAYEYGKDCVNILPPDLLFQYYTKVHEFYIQMKEVNGPLAKREIYDRFILDQRFWVIHHSHYSLCAYDFAACKCAAKGASLCTAINSHVYVWNVFGSDTSLGATSETMKRFSKKTKEEVEMAKAMITPKSKPRPNPSPFIENDSFSDQSQTSSIHDLMPSTPTTNFRSDNDSDSDNDDSNVNEPLLLCDQYK